jgi:hypothetical protein
MNCQSQNGRLTCLRTIFEQPPDPKCPPIRDTPAFPDQEMIRPCQDPVSADSALLVSNPLNRPAGGGCSNTHPQRLERTCRCRARPGADSQEGAFPGGLPQFRGTLPRRKLRRSFAGLTGCSRGKWFRSEPALPKGGSLFSGTLS